MGKHSKYRTEDYCVADAVSGGFSELEELASECREMFDNASEGLQQTQRLQTFDETASTLEGLCEPDVPEYVGELRFQVRQEIPNRPRRGLSRATRRDNAVALLQGAMEAIQERIEKWEANRDEEGATEAQQSENQDYIDEAQSLVDELESAIGDAEGTEFPGMYG